MLSIKTITISVIVLFTVQALQAQSWQPNAPHIYFNGGNVGIGTSTPGVYALSIERSNTDGGNTDAPIISVRNTSTLQPNGNGYNSASANFFAGNGAVLGQFNVCYGIGATAPFNAGSGIYITSRTDHPIIFATGASTTEKMRITANGYVGIGVASPIRALQVNGTVLAHNSQDVAGFGGLSLGDAGGHYWGFRRTATGSHLAIDAWNGSANVEYLRVLSNNGNVGIGITNPEAKLTVNSANPKFRMVNSGGRTIGNSINYEFAVDGSTQNALGGFSFINTGGANGVHDYKIELWDGSTGAPERFRIQGSTGNIGIGIATPAAKLDVNGNLKATGFVLPTGAAAGKVLTSDANGVASWQTAAGGSAGWAFGGNSVTTVTNFGTTSNNSLPFITNNIERMRIDAATGNVGIGTATPGTKLEVNGDLQLYTGNTDGPRFVWRGGVNGTMEYRARVAPNGALAFFPGEGLATTLILDQSGNVGIGTTLINNADYRLFVEKGIRTRKVKVDQAIWSDYVFHTNYHLRPLSEVEQYIKQHRHLPEVPSAAEIKKDGLDLGDNQATLLKKIEELTLYLIAQDNEIKALKEKNGQLESLRDEVKELKELLKNNR